MNQEEDVLLSVEGLHVRYGRHEVVKGVSFTLAKGEILGIVGESGSGKSTIAKAIMGLERPSSGSVVYAPRPGARKSPSRAGAPGHVQMIFQDATGSLNPRMTVRQTLDETIKVWRAADVDAKGLLSMGE